MDKIVKVDILAIGAHPDDVELSCAGTLINEVRKGQTVGILDLTKGELGTRGTVESRKEEAEDAAKIIGASFRKILDLGDGTFQNAEAEQKAIMQVIRACKPDIVLGNALDDRHPDHGRAATLIKDACFFSGLRMIETKDETGRVQEAFRPRLLMHYIQDRWITPDIVIDISDSLETKMKAVDAFKSQFFDPNSKEPETYISSSKFRDGIIARAQEMARQKGFTYGEGFCLHRPPGVKNLMDIF